MKKADSPANMPGRADRAVGPAGWVVEGCARDVFFAMKIYLRSAASHLVILGSNRRLQMDSYPPLHRKSGWPLGACAWIERPNLLAS